MQPEVSQGAFIIDHANGERSVIPLEYADDVHVTGPIHETDETERRPEAYVARLSAPGYMDATDWTGPFDTEEQALVALREMYGDDDNEESDDDDDEESDDDDDDTFGYGA